MDSEFNPPHYKLIYFPAMGRGEALRYLFAVAEVDYEEEVIQMADFQAIKSTEVDYEEEVIQMADFQAIKSNFAFGTLPVLQVTDKHGVHTLVQTLSIARYLAKRFGLAGRTILEQAQADMVVDGCNEMWNGIGPVFRAILFGADQATTTEAKTTFIEQTFKPMMTKLNALLNSNQQSDGKYFVGDRITYADLYVGEWLGRVSRVIGSHALDDHPQMRKFMERIESIPQIQKRIKNRPPTPM